MCVMAIALGLPSCFTNGWRRMDGTPTKKMGLLYIEILGCGSGSASGGNILGAVANMGCAAFSHESQQGMMSWEAYQAATCRDAASSAVCLSSNLASNMLDPTGYCSSIRLRCEKLEGAKIVNYFTFSAIVVGCICSALSGFNVCRDDERLKAICYSVFATMLILVGNIVYWGLGTEYFEEASMTSINMEGYCLYTTMACLLCSMLQTFCAFACLPAAEVDDDDEESGRSKKSKKNKGKLLAAAAASVDSYGATPDPSQNVADYNLRNMSQMIKAMGGNDLDSAFRGFDVNGDGLVSQQEFMSGIQQLNLGLNPEQSTWLMQWLDVNKDGYVSYGEFIEVMKKYENDPGYVYSA